jgi:hypothetical protein
MRRFREFEATLFDPPTPDVIDDRVKLADSIEFYLDTKAKKSFDRQRRLRNQLTEMRAYLKTKRENLMGFWRYAAYREMTACCPARSLPK